ncbi:hypothetical protein K4F52_009830 [Lecanicillium sp. MT-2017a]|nr:hypothetical protein K4F52_009830 [Lecanicillium sp. MT-2017a]
MHEFEYNVLPSRVVFGSGSVNKLPNEIKRLGVSRPLILSTAGRSHYADQISGVLKAGSIDAAGIFPRAKQHTPTEVSEEAAAILRQLSADCVVSVGGGSVIGLGKAVSIRTGVPHICLPTTYSGSEMTPILGETKDGKKTTRSDAKILPGVMIYDADLTVSLPPAVSSTSGVNAMAHAVEALYAKNTNPVISLMSLEGIRALVESLPKLVQNPNSKDARDTALYGSWLCGTALGSTNMGLHHKLCHVLGGTFGLPHAETHCIMLAHTLAYNAPCIPGIMTKLASVFPESNGDAVRGLELLLDKLQVTRSLKDIGLKESDISQAVEIATSGQYPNPRVLEAHGIRDLLRRAWAGDSARVIPNSEL